MADRVSRIVAIAPVDSDFKLTVLLSPNQQSNCYTTGPSEEIPYPYGWRTAVHQWCTIQARSATWRNTQLGKSGGTIVSINAEYKWSCKKTVW